MNRFKSFSSKLLMLFIFSVIIPIILMLIVLSYSFSKKLYSENIKQLENTLNSVSNNVDTYLDDLKRLTLTPYLYNETFKFMYHINNNNNSDNNNMQSIDLYKLNRNYSSTLNKIINHSREDIVGITFIPYNELDKSFLVSKYYDTLNIVPTPTYYDEWLNKTLELDGDSYFTPVHTADYYNNGNDYKVFSIMRVIKDMDNRNNIVGIIKVDAMEKTLKDIISSVNISDNSIFLLLDDVNQIIYSKNSNSIISTDSLDLYNDRSKIEKNFSILSESIDANDWELFYLDSKKDLFRGLNIIFLFIFIVISLFFVFTLLLFKLNSKKIVNSMTDIISTMGEIEMGNLDTHVNITGTYEFEAISNSLNIMVSKLKSHIEAEYKAIIRQKNAEYLALQAQINPHFLHNVLNGFIALNRLNEKKLLEDSLIQLSKLYRYNCHNSNISTLYDEIYFVEKYLQLEILRFDDLVTYEFNIDEITKDIVIPKLIIQPFVENSIKHGIGESPILIKISSKFIHDNESKKSLELTISDNGVGFNSENTNLDTSTGIKNVRERVSIFAENSSIEIISSPGNGTTCYIKIPIRSED